MWSSSHRELLLCVCGEKLRDPVEEFRLAEQRRKAAFKAAAASYMDFPKNHVAEACWLAAATKYQLTSGAVKRRGELCPDAYALLRKTEECAKRLYTGLVDLLDME